MGLDLKTLYVIGVVTCFLAGGSFILSWHYHRHLPALRGWAVGLLLIGGGLLLLGFRGVVHEAISLLLANILIVSGFTAIWVSVSRFNTGALAIGRVSLVAAAFAALFTGTWLAGIGAQTHPVIVAVFLGGLSLLSGWQVVIGGRTEPLRSRLPTAIAFMLMGLIFIGRVVNATTHDLSASDPVLVWMLFGVLICLSALNFGMLMMANERLRNRYELLATTDELTGLLNRRSLMERGERLVHRTLAGGAAVSVLLLDLDHFREVNRLHGHEGGDNTLKAFADFLQEQIRPTDLVCRYGGEEFCVILLDADIAQGKLVAERFRADLESLPIHLGERTISITVSIGVASVEQNDLRGAIRNADGALYLAKGLGRNRVCP